MIRPVPRGPRRWIGILLILAVLLIAAGIVSALVLDQRLSGTAPTARSGQSSGTEPDRAVGRTGEVGRRRRT